jgi:enamine deaminase RidA (YjgF/YER057c/UK114 family)
VVKITTYVASSDRSVLETVWSAIEQSVIATAASTMVGVETLYYDDQLVEIEAVAIV